MATVEKIKNRFNASVEENGSEAGMEAAQVILILVLVVMILIPIVLFISNKLKQKGQGVGNTIDGNNGAVSVNPNTGQ